MTTREQRTEYSSNVVRTLHPSRPLSPTNAEFDSNLDYLLDDLQQSVSRPGSSLGQNASSNLTSSREIQYLSPQNSSTVVRERSVSPSGQKSERLYKTAKYEYKTSSSTPSYSAQANIHQLDTLLDDLKHERELAVDKLDRSNKDTTDSLIPGSTKIIKTTYSSSSNLGGSKPMAQRELHFETPVSNKLKSSRQEYSSNYESKIEKSSASHGDVSYDSYAPEKLGKESKTIITKSYNQSKSPVTTISKVDGGTLVHDIPVESDILPRPGTKVTTTVRTYTYEIPPEESLGTHSTIYKNESFNRLTNDSRRKRDLSPTTNHSLVSRSENVSTLTRHDDRPVSPSPPMKRMYYQQDTLETTKTRTYSPTRDTGYLPPVDRSITYKHDTTDSTRSVVKPPPPTNWKSNPPSGQPGSTYFYREETNTTTNRRFPQDGYAPPPNMNGYPPVNPSPSVSYKYSSHTTTTNNVHRLPPDEVDDGVKLAPFPTDGIENVPNNTQPPKRLDDLLASFGDSPPPRHYHEGQIPEKPYTLTKDSLVETASPEQKIPTKNVAGPPVYYPPGELFTKKEESGAAWRAQGGYARGAGKYQYEAEEKSKSKSKSGGAVVPVCLPLCCAMPCSIM
ncbi:proteoglycan 4 [Phlebotomus argentipes]|uniref:proteoglycan 4 n=1 Tax=Phlebotomus argentipes TaxID=94469 RepID=UPI0028936D23|nr:proteoglycan 4 [Phlebotomus argentipes]